MAALIIASGAGMIAAAPSSMGEGGCGTNFGDFLGEFTAREDPANVIRFDDAGGVTFRSVSYGNGSGIFAVMPSGGFSAALRMTDHAPGDTRPANATGMIKSTVFLCENTSPQVTSFTSLDQDSRNFDYVRST
ncbi:hypothetical protein [Nocardia jejuensis]|uniref:hypothetical protein n=1 Tax=Nocardia jejuensis TaxID=328049 RepID=UPI0008300904|nr:hypothetical protein [Nocardia jejuensis]